MSSGSGTGQSIPRTATDPRWVEVALADLDAVLCDHLHCERKAAQSALSLVRNYPDRMELVEAVARLAHEETSHVVQVSQVLQKRGALLSYDVGDDYAHALRQHIRKREPERLLDSLIVFALIEARSAERLGLLANALSDPELDSLYRGLANAEVRHRDTFLHLAASVIDETSWRDRLAELAEAEAAILAGLPIRPRIH
ncbi:MAG: tRNA-(ms[2]io[6]A)-hydroxylase [Proteobacteria bacterium]|nr:tRNA-(ms[2]io[6]A)-hydroxylase [Pseudomonadota bacterium]